MNIIFMGNPQFAVPSLELLVKNGIRIKAVVTDPPKKSGRGRSEREQPVAEIANQIGLPLLQPTSLSDPNFIDSIRSINPDLVLVVAFKILPSKLLSIPTIGSVNLHASLLPAYRGAAPIQWSLMNGDTETGLTTFFLQPKIDTGNILFQGKIEILPKDDYESLSKKMSAMGSELLLKTVNTISDGPIKQVPQDESSVSQAPKIFPEMGHIDWNQSADSISNLIRGLSPKPGAFSNWNNRKIKFFNPSFESTKSAEPGKIHETENGLLKIGTSSGILVIREVQIEGKKRMPVADFLRGSAMKSGDTFES
ncbi:MAG: methionyl-tRNA formyltransferase [Candidatus Marinimicrobia bacterium]|nr:methionyl-tRNA formyltransferase [Candidatus Neomarinimicrobiota bacterium]MDP6789360.1 methionyl-tRNA formyltransferase [Candidatus Neomarinimicrobiota bacterium]MDP7072728.1 methionyl-tRNA formyltransferase [Candidatus Neomarinimicrobiota bacterium]